jgi:ADP-heptose:LPS heptosyltransferase
MRRTRILVIRNDRLGDFMLAWPSFAMLKSSLPSCEVLALVPAYTAELARVCPWLDGVVLDPGRGSGLAAALRLARALRAGRFEAAIALFSTGRIAAITLLAGIPYRLAPATKAAQVLYSRRVSQRRSRSLKPEFEYNLDLVRAYLAEVGATPVAVAPPYLRFADADVAGLRRAFCAQERLDPWRPILFLHPGSGGSTTSLPAPAFAELAAALSGGDGPAVVVTAGPTERALAESVATEAVRRGGDARVLQVPGVVDFARRLAFADAFVGGSTGPLHLAGALDRPTAGFYPRTPTGGSLRWRTLNSPGRALAFEPPASAGPMDLAAIDVFAAARAIRERLLKGAMGR